jgi:hypothetical protein
MIPDAMARPPAPGSLADAPGAVTFPERCWRSVPVQGDVEMADSPGRHVRLGSPKVQHAVDRRFNRARYDAERTVAAFAARLQDTVDADAVRGDLTDVVQAALEPTHASVWLGQ